MDVRCVEAAVDTADQASASGHLAETPPLERIAYSVADAALVSGLSRTTLYELIKSGTLRSVKVKIGAS